MALYDYFDHLYNSLFNATDIQGLILANKQQFEPLILLLIEQYQQEREYAIPLF